MNDISMPDLQNDRKSSSQGYSKDGPTREKEPKTQSKPRSRSSSKKPAFVRLFVNVIDDDKLQCLEAPVFRAFILFMCATRQQGDGFLPPIAELTRWVRASKNETNGFAHGLMQAGFLERVAGDTPRLRFRSWSKYQPSRGRPSPKLGYWLRLNTGIRKNRKIMRLSAETFRSWINILCLAKQDRDGALPDLNDIAWDLQLDLVEASKCLDGLIAAGLIDVDMKTGRYCPHDWYQWQTKPSAERVKNFRERKKAEAEKVTSDVTPDVTPTETASPSLSLFLYRTKRSDSSVSTPAKSQPEDDGLDGAECSDESEQPAVAEVGPANDRIQEPHPPGWQSDLPQHPDQVVLKRHRLPAKRGAHRPGRGGQSKVRDGAGNEGAAVSEALRAFPGKGADNGNV